MLEMSEKKSGKDLGLCIDVGTNPTLFSKGQDLDEVEHSSSAVARDASDREQYGRNDGSSSCSLSVVQSMRVTDRNDEMGLGFKPIFIVGSNSMGKRRKVHLKKRVVGPSTKVTESEGKGEFADDQGDSATGQGVIAKRKTLDSDVDMEDSELMLKRSCVEYGSCLNQSGVAVVGCTQPREQQ